MRRPILPSAQTIHLQTVFSGYVQHSAKKALQVFPIDESLSKTTK